MGFNQQYDCLLMIPLHMSQYHQMQMQQTFNRTLTNWLNGNKNGSNMIHQQNTWDVPFHQTSNGEKNI